MDILQLTEILIPTVSWVYVNHYKPRPFTSGNTDIGIGPLPPPLTDNSFVSGGITKAVIGTRVFPDILAMLSTRARTHLY
jgi:hypothetical protein